MAKLMVLNILLIHLFTVYTTEEIVWNEGNKKVSIEASFKNCSEALYKKPWKMINFFNRIYHHKTHFGIIVKKGSNITITVSAIDDGLRFFCLCKVIKSQRTFFLNRNPLIITADDDCVPMISDTYHTEVRVTIETNFWIELPTFKSNDVTSSKEEESKFYTDLKLYGFVENTYTQMLLSSDDISILRENNYTLNDGLLKQKKVLKYYDSLFGIGTERGLCNSKAVAPSGQHTILFLMVTHPNKGSCNIACYSNDLIGFQKILPFLKSSGESSWTLLIAFGHYYEINRYLIGFGYIDLTWSMIYAIFFQRTNDKEIYTIRSSNAYEDIVKPYKNGVAINKWSSEGKLHFFLSLFEYGGGDRTLREFHNSYAREESNFKENVNIIPILVRLFLEIHQINIFPYLKKVINFESYAMPLINPDLELLLESGHPVMPALDFNLSSTDWSDMVQRQGFRQTSALTLFYKVKEKFVRVKFIITPFSMSMMGIFLYLNNVPHQIINESFELTLPRDVYSVYIAESSHISEVKYHVIATNHTTITIHVNKTEKNDISSPLIHYFINVKDDYGKSFFKIFINYKRLTISLQKLSFKSNEQGFYVALKRDFHEIFSFLSHHNRRIILFNNIFSLRMNDRLLIHIEKSENVIINERKLNDLIINQWTTLVFKEIAETDIKKSNFYVSNEQYYITATDSNDKDFLVINVNYNTHTMFFKQMKLKPSVSVKTDVYFAVKLERNNKFIYVFSISSEGSTTLLERNQTFEINDKLHLLHFEPSRLFIAEMNLSKMIPFVSNRKFNLLPTSHGLMDDYDVDMLFLKANINQIVNFYTLHENSLRYNPLYNYYVDKYVDSIKNHNYTDKVLDVLKNLPIRRSRQVKSLFLSRMSDCLVR